MFRVNRDIFLRTLSLIFAFAYFTAKGAEFGETTLAANAILMQLQNVLSYGLDGFAHAAETLVGSAFGARDRTAFRAAVRVSTIWATGVALLFAAVLALGGPAILGLFTDIPEVRERALTFLPWMIASPFVSIWAFQLDGIFIGATQTRAMRNAMLACVALYVAAVWLLTPTLANHGLWLALIIFLGARGGTLAAAYPTLERRLHDRREHGL
jgi:MATE family multidrug resistance protein